MKEESQVPLEVSRDQEILAHVLVALFSQPARDVGMRKEKADLIGGALHRMRKQSGVFVKHLQGNASGRGSNHGLFLPQRFGDSQPEALAQAFLNDDSGSALKRIHL